ncbi:restriction endonuclease subunit S [Vallitalea sediminicola]
MKLINITKLCNVEIGKTPSRNEMTYWGTGVNWVSIRDMKEKYIFDTNEKITSKAISETGIKLVPKNTVIMSFKLSVGKVAIVGKDMYTNEAIAAFHILDESKLYNKYLYYALQTLRLSDNTDRAVMGLTLNKKKLKQISIPVPPLEAQKKIVEALDKAQGLIDARKEQIRLIDELIQSVFYEMFGDPIINPMRWKVDKLDKHVISIDSGWSPKCLNNKAPNNEWGVLKLSAVTGGMYNEEQNKELPKGVEPRVNLEIKKGDLLLTRKNTPELVGDCCYVFETRGKLMMPDIIFRINTLSEIDKTFLWALFNNHTFKQRIKMMASGSAKSMVNISKAKLNNLDIIVPDYEVQLKFSSKLNHIRKKNNLLKESLYKLENCLKSIMQKAFSGELH